ncbi:MAG: diguanylate cyclase [Chloroflexota bacterium]|jgi:diguanylate cyclase (GGDEF)-like protein|nr:diguanylate cyclase [Chloroflexota bacterium]
MVLARPASDRRPMLLALVLGVVLVLVGVTASALLTITSVRLTDATLNAVVTRDGSLMGLFVNGSLRADDLDADGPSSERVDELAAAMTALSARDTIARIELRSLDGRVLASSADGAVGETAPASQGMALAASGQPWAVLAEAGTALDATGRLANPHGMVEEYLPVNADGRTVAVIALWRDAGAVMETIAETNTQVMLVLLAAGALLSGMLFLLFRATQARLTRQHRQLIEATRRDSLTGLLNHGAAVSELADAVESARRSEDRIGVALIDVDGFRLFNDTHGHEAGDKVLVTVAQIVATVGGPAGIARYGPDEFVIMRPGAGVDEIRDVVDRLRAELEQASVQFGDSEALPISISAGICAFPDHATSVTDLLSAAAVALAEAKASGGDSVRVAQVGEEERVVTGSFDILQGLVIAVDTKDRYTKRHSEDVARYAVFLARRVGLDDEMLRTIQLAGLLHDIGKIGIPDVILRKPSKLTAEEYGMFQQHVALGEAIVRDVPNAELVRAGILHHHERWDGNGYLAGLEGDEIPLIGRILAVADAFSAMTTTRPYRKALPLTEALKRLGDAAGGQLEEGLVTEFIAGIETAPDAPLPGEDPVALWKPELWVA